MQAGTIVAGQNAFGTVVVSQAGTVATVMLHRPSALNALNAIMIDELAHVFAALADDQSVRVVLLTGSGNKAFAAGADIRGLLACDAAAGEAVSQHGQQVFSRVERYPKPVIACINGVALGGGLELSMCCTLRIASDTARLGMPELKLGLVPGYGGTVRLAKLVGRGAALKMLLTGEFLSAPEALRLGLVQDVAPAADLMARAHELADTITGMAPLAVAAMLELLNGQSAMTFDEALRAETEAFGRLCGTEDKGEGVSAFLAKRPPVWQGS